MLSSGSGNDGGSLCCVVNAATATGVGKKNTLQVYNNNIIRAATTMLVDGRRSGDSVRGRRCGGGAR